MAFRECRRVVWNWWRSLSLKRTDHKRRFSCEPLEARQILSVSPMQISGALSPYVGQAAPVEVGNSMYVQGYDSSHGVELWKTDGTSFGTVMVRDIRPGSNFSSPANMTNVNGTLFFTASDGVHGNELWKSDGTSAGTVMLGDINLGAAGSNPSSLTNVNGTLYFIADNGAGGRNYELWKSDGTSGGTVQVAETIPGSNMLSQLSPSNVNGTFYFWSSQTGRGLWRSDGTSQGTLQVSSVYAPGPCVDLNGVTYFEGSGATDGLWKTDGTSSGTQLVSTIPGTNLTEINGKLFFASSGATQGTWTSDGTSAGTMRISTLFPQSQVFASARYTNINGTVFFPSSDGTHGNELWKTDGTCAGTVLVNDLNLGVTNSWPNGMTVVGGNLYFVANDGVHGDALWRTDGTSAGTLLITNSGGAAITGVAFMANGNGTLYFTSGTQLWVMKNAANTPITYNVSAVQGAPSAIYFTRAAGDSAEVPWLKVTGITGGILYQHDGVTQINNGNFVPFPNTVNTGLWFVPAGTAGCTLYGQASTRNNDSGLGGNPVLVPITVTPINHAPTLGLNSTTINVQGSAGAQTIAGCVGSASASDAGQIVDSYLVTTNNNAIFSVLPTIDTSGTLHFTPSTNVGGTAIVTVRAHDNGGTANGGVDTSAPQTFVIAVHIPLAHTLPAPQTVIPGTTVYIPGVSITDPSGTGGNVQVTLIVSHGVINILTVVSGGVTAGQVTNNASSQVTILAPLSAINATFADSAGFGYVLNSGYTAGDRLTISTNDLGNNSSSTPLLATDSLTLNLVNGPFTLSGNSITINGSGAADVFSFQQTSATTALVQLNGTPQNIDSSVLKTVIINAGVGDTVYALDSSAVVDTLNFAGPGALILTNAAFTVQASGATAIIVYGDAGDAETMTGSSGDDVYYGYPNAAIIAMGSQYAVAVGVTNTTVQATSGQDAAVLVGSSGDDIMTAHPSQTTFVGAGYSETLNGWTHVYAIGNGGTDSAQLYDDTTNDEYHALSSFAVLLGPRPTGWATFLLEPIGFGTVRATASAGGTDLAVLYDTTNNELFSGNQSLSALWNSAFRVEAESFDYVYGLATSGGYDYATLDGSTGNDYLFANGPLAQYYSYGNGATIQLYYFDAVVATSNGGSDGMHRVDPLDYVLTLQGTWVNV